MESASSGGLRNYSIWIMVVMVFPAPPPTDQLKSVMEQVLDFAVRELTKIVEASFDDLLLEITKMECEQQVLEERLDRGAGEKGRGGGRRRGSENDSLSPSDSEDAREELADIDSSKKMTRTDGEEQELFSPSPCCDVIDFEV